MFDISYAFSIVSTNSHIPSFEVRDYSSLVNLSLNSRVSERELIFI